jgi:hypothetical protein
LLYFDLFLFYNVSINKYKTEVEGKALKIFSKSFFKVLKAYSFGLVFVAILIGFVGAYIFSSYSPANAATYDYINFQGKLTDNAGFGLVNQTRSVTFCIFNASSGGSCTSTPSGQLWYETKNVTTDARGIFNSSLGDTTSFGTLFTNNSNNNLYLAVNVAGDGEMTPRHPISSVPHAFNSDRLQGYQASDFALASGDGNYIQNQNSIDQTANFRIGGNGALTGTLSVGTTDTTSKVVIKGTGTTASTTSLNIQNSNGTSYFLIADDGSIVSNSDPANNNAGFDYGNGYNPNGNTYYSNEDFRIESFFNSPQLSMGVAVNYLLRTEEFDSSTWVKTNIDPVSANTRSAPNGATSAEDIPAGTLATSNISQNVTNSTTGYWTAGIWARTSGAGATGTIQLEIDSSGGAGGQTGTPKTINVDNRWRFYTVTQNLTVGHTTKTFRVISGTTAISLWGAQMNPGQDINAYLARTTSYQTSALAGAFFNTTIYGTLSGGASTAGYSNYGIYNGFTLSDTADKTNQWEYVGNMYIEYSSTQRYGFSLNSELWLKEHSTDNSIRNQATLETVKLQIKGYVPSHADANGFNAAVPEISLQLSGETSLSVNDVAALVYSSSTSSKYIRIYVRLKNPNTHYSILPINRYCATYGSTNGIGTNCYMNVANTQAVVANLPTPVQGSVAYATEGRYLMINGSNANGPIDLGAHNLTIDTNTFFVDATAHSVGIGTITPTTGKLVIKGATSDNTANALNVTNSNDAALLTIRNDGNIGVGTSNPGGFFTLNGPSNNTALLGLNPGDASNAIINLSPSSDGIVRFGIRLDETNKDIHFDYRVGATGQAATAMSIQRSSGNVGIGATTPGAKLHVNYGNTPVSAVETLRLEVTGNTGTDRGPLLNFYAPAGSGTSSLAASIGGITSTGSASGQLIFSTVGSSTLTERMRINEAGNVGIGTGTARANLDVLTDGGRIVVGGSGNGGGIRFGANSANNSIEYASGEFGIHTNQASGMVFYTSGTTKRMSILDGGNVGVGNITPGYLLDVNGSTRITNSGDFILQAATDDVGDIIFRDSTTAQKGRIWTSSSNGVASMSLSSGDTTADIFINTTGNVGIGTTSTGTRQLAVTGSSSNDVVVEAITNRTTGANYGFRSLATGVGGSANYAVYASASGATNNYSGIFELGNFGIGDTTPASLLTVGNNDVFQVDTNGDMVKIKNVTYSWPSSNGSGFLSNNGSGTLTWTASSGVDHGSLGGLGDDDHTQYALLAGRSGGQTLIGGTAANNILTLQGNSATTGNTTTSANIQFKVGDSGGTTAMTILNDGKIAMGVASTSFNLQVGGTVGASYNDGAIAVTPYNRVYPGILGRFQENNDVGNGNSYFTYVANGMYHTNAGAEDSYYVYNQYVNGQTMTMNAEGFRFWYADASADGQTVTASELMRLNNTGNLGVGLGNPTGRIHSYIGSGAVTADQYTGYMQNLATNTTTDGINKYGMYITSTGNFVGSTGTATNNYGLYVNTPTGADNNYAAVFAGGYVGIGVTTPSRNLDVDTSFRLSRNGNYPFEEYVRSDNAGAAKFAERDYYARDASNNSEVFATEIFETTNATHGSEESKITWQTYSSGTLTSSLTLAGNKVGIGIAPTARLTLPAGTATANTAPLKFTAGTNLTAAEAGAVEWDGTNLYITQTSGPTRKTIAYTDSFSGTYLSTTLNSGYVFVGNGSNIATGVDMSGDVDIATNGTATIQDNSVDGTDIALGSDATGDIMYYNGTDYVRLAGSAGFLKSTGAAAPAWSALTDTDVPDTITLTNITQITNRDHGSLTGLSDDDHTQYALLAGRAGSQTLIGGTAANNTLTLQGNSANTGNTSTNTAMQFKVGDSGGITAMTINNSGNISGTGTNLLSSLILDTHPESGTAVVPFINNDIAYVTLRGGSCTASFSTCSPSLFDGAPSYAYYTSSDLAGGLTIEVTLHKTFSWGNKIGVSFGNAGWRSKYLKMEAYRDDTSSWDTFYEASANTQPIVQSAYNTSGYTISKIRMTFNDFNSTIFRIADIWLLNYSSTGPKEVFLARDGGTMYGNITFSDGNNLVAGTSTGTMVGTSASQKLGFFGASPIVKPTGNIITALQNLGLVSSGTLSATDVGLGNVSNNAQLVAGNSTQNGYFHNVYLDDTNASHHLILDYGSDVSADQTLTLLSTGSYNLTIANNASVSGTNTGDQTITLQGDVTGTGTGTFTTTIADNSVDGTDIALGSDATGDIMYYNGTDYVRLAGSAGFLKSTGAAAPTWSALTDSDVPDTITLTNITQITNRDHGSLTGLSDDDHSIYALLAGRSGGQILTGGTGTTDDLILKTTSGVGASGADMIFQTGSNGGTEAMRILYDGNVGVGTTNITNKLSIGYADSNTTGWSAGGQGLGIRNSDGTNNTWSTLSFYGSNNIAAGIGTRLTDQANSYGELAFYTRGSDGWGERLRINNTGIGIGYSAPMTSLDVRKANQDLTGNVAGASSVSKAHIAALSNTALAIDAGGSIGLGGVYNDSGNQVLFGAIAGRKTNATSANTSGYLAFYTNTSGSGLTEKARLNDVGNFSASTLTSTVAIGTAPLTVTSTTVVTNLNADMIDGNHIGTLDVKSGYSTTLTTTGWYRIASNGPVSDGGTGGDRASALFDIRDTRSSYHSSTTVYASVLYGSHPTLTMQNRSYFSGNGVIKKVRIVEGDVYEGAAVEVYFDGAGGASPVSFTIRQNEQSAGWTAVNWTAGDVPTGFDTTVLDLDTYDPIFATASDSIDNSFFINRSGNLYTGDVNLLDSDGSNYLSLTYSSNVASNQTLSLATTGSYTLTVANNASVSGTNTGDQTITLQGDVTGTGTGTFTTTIADNSVDGTDISLASEAQGDVMYFNGTDWVRIAGSNGGVLRSTGTGVSWVASTTGTTYLTNTNGTITWGAAPGGVTDHGALTGLGNDDHSIYALLAGRTGGQTLIGGSGTTDGLILRTTSGVGASGADMIFQTGNNGTTEAMRILYDGNIGVGVSPNTDFEVAGISRASRSGLATQYLQMNGGDANGIYLTAISSAGAQKPLYIDSFVGEAPVANNSMRFRIGQSGSPTTAMMIDYLANIGIGNSNPYERMDVTGDILASDRSSLGIELLDNGTFTGGTTGWTLGSGWTYNSNNVIHSSGTASMYRSTGITLNQLYRVSFTVSGVTTGSVTPQLGGVNGAAVSTNTTSVQTIMSGSTSGSILFSPTTDFNGVIDDVSVRQYNGGSITSGGLGTFSNILLANPGFNTESRLTFAKLTDSAYISVNEVSSDATEFSFNMTDNPDQATDKFFWRMSDWQGKGGTWVPLQFNGLNMQITAANTNIYSKLNVLGPSYLANGVPNTTSQSDLAITRTGTASLTPNVSGYTGTTSVVYWVKITTNGTPDQYTWGTGAVDSNVGGSNVAITGSAQALSNGVTISFDSTTAGALNDVWQFRVNPGGLISFGTDVKDKIYLYENGSNKYGFGINSGELNIFGGDSGSINMRTGGPTGTSMMYLDASTGNVGIGNTNPASGKLVVGDGASDTRIMSNSNTPYSFRARNGSGNPDFYFGATTTGDGVFSDNVGAELMRITSTGNVGIGDDTPTSRLTVTGTGSVATVGTSNLLTATGTFANSTGWTVGSWSIGSGVATHASGTTAMTGTSTATSTTTMYQIKFDIPTVTVSGEGFSVSLGGTSTGDVFYTAGTDLTTYVVPASGSGTVAFVPGSTFAGTIDNVRIYAVTASTADSVIQSSDGVVGPLELRSGGSAKYNTFVGSNAGAINVFGTNNSAFGADALSLNTSGSSNSAFGVTALAKNTSGSGNSAFGLGALALNTAGSNNAAFGSAALNQATTGVNNTALGASAMQFASTGGSNTGVGHAALFSIATGSGNVAVGTYTLYSTTANFNTAVGFAALADITSGSQNTAIGYQAGRFLPDLTTPNVLSSTSVYLGSYTSASASGNTNEIVIGDTAQGAGSNSVVLGNDSITKTLLKGNVGVGTSLPTGKLDVLGNISSTTAGSTYTASKSGTTITATSGTFSANTEIGKYFVWANGTVDVITGYTDSTHVTVATSGTITSQTGYTRRANISVDSVNGRLGINNAAPTGKLDIRTSNTYAGNAVIASEVSDNTSLRLYRTTGAATTQAYPWYIENTVGELQFKTGSAALIGSETVSAKMTIESDGDVGIGTTDPDFVFDVNVGVDDTRIYGNGQNGTGLILGNTYTGGHGWYIASGTTNGKFSIIDLGSGVIDFSGSPSERVTLLPSGNFGIGDVTPASMLTVGDGDLFQVSSTGDMVKIKNLTYSWPSAHTTGGFLKNGGTGTLSWSTLADADVPNAITINGGTISGTNSISGTLTTTGSLTLGDNGDTIGIDASSWDISTGGIITTPGYVSITGGADASGNLRFSAANPYITASSYTVMPGGLYVSGGNLYTTNQINARGGIGNDTGTILTINGGTSDITYMTGNVGFATNAPSATYSITSDNGAYIRTGRLRVDSVTETSGANHLCYNANFHVVQCAASSARYKENISTFSADALSELESMRVITFNYKAQYAPDGDTETEYVGLIAEEVAQVDKRFTIFEADGVTPHNVRYDNLVALAIKGIQEQQGMINGSMDQIANNIAEINALKSQTNDNTLSINDLNSEVVANTSAIGSLNLTTTNISGQISNVNTELFTSHQDLQPDDLVSLKTDGSKEVIKSENDNDPIVIGTVKEKVGGNLFRIVLTGRVKVNAKVVNNEPILSGDYLTTAKDFPGMAVKAKNTSIAVVGIALDAATEDGEIEILLRQNYTPAGSTGLLTPIQSAILGMFDIAGDGHLVVNGDLEIKGNLKLSDNNRGYDVQVPAGRTYIDIYFAKPRTDNKYAATVSTKWFTNVAITQKASDRFRVEFSTPPPTGSTIDWIVID